MIRDSDNRTRECYAASTEPTASLLYRGMSISELQSQYQPALHVDSLQAIIDDWAERAESARLRLAPRRIPYGNHPDEWFWYLEGASPGAPLVAFLHGGYWRRLSADDGLILAEAAVDNGLAFASINYSLCPTGPLSLLIDQSQRAVAHLLSEARALGHGPVHLAGHSAGAHLAASTVLSEERLAGLVLVSGIFDITPIVHTPINDDVRMTATEASAWSPMGRCPRRPLVRCTIAYGSLETTEFARQSTEWASEWSSVAGNLEARLLKQDGRHHFDVIDDLLTRGNSLGNAVLATIQ